MAASTTTVTHTLLDDAGGKLVLAGDALKTVGSLSAGSLVARLRTTTVQEYDQTISVSQGGGGYTGPAVIPAGFTARWAFPMGVSFINGKPVSDDVGIPTIPANPAVTIYCHPQLGLDTNSGVNPYSATIAGGGVAANNTGPVKTLGKGLLLANGGVLFIDASANYTWVNSSAWMGVGANLTLGVYVINRSGFRLISATLAVASPVWTLVSGTVYSCPGTVSTVGGVTDIATTVQTPTNTKSYFIPPVKTSYGQLKKVADQATVAATVNSYWLDTTNNLVYVNVGRALTTNDTSLLIGSLLNANGTIATAASGLITYVDGIDFIGGNNPMKPGNTSQTFPVTFVFKNCLFEGGSSNGNGLSVIGPHTGYLYRCVAAWNWADGFNGHSTSADGSNTNSPNLFFNECVSYGNGTTGSTNTSDNAFTIHDGIPGFMLNCYAPDSDDVPLAAGGNFTAWWILGGYVGYPTNVVNMTTAPFTIGAGGNPSVNCDTWIDSVTFADPPAGWPDYQVASGQGGRMHIRGMNPPPKRPGPEFTANISATLGTMDTY